MTGFGRIGTLLAAAMGLTVVASAEPTRVGQGTPAPSDVVRISTDPAGPQRTSPAPQRVSSLPSVAEFDARIRRVDREGPGGAIQLWVYNAGPGAAVGCTIATRSDTEAELEPAASVEAVGPRQTVKISEPLPVDAAEFRLDCPGEPESALADNVATYHFELAWPQKAE